MQRAGLEDGISLSEVIESVVRRWKSVALVLGFALLSVAIRWWIMEAQYEARARLIVLAPNRAVTDLQTLELYRNLVPTYHKILTSRRVMDAVRAGLGLQWSEEEYRKRVRIEADEESQTLDVLVRSTSPDEAARIATGAAEVMTRVAADVMKENRLILLDPAVPPKDAVAPKVPLEFALAIILGLMAGTGVAVLQEKMDRRIRDETAVERRLGLPVLGTIPHIDM